MPDIAGMMLVSRCGGMLYTTVPELLKWCDRVLLVMDNEDNPTRIAAETLKGTYGGRIEIKKSGFGRLPAWKEKSEPKDVYRRFRGLQGKIRDKAIRLMRDWKPPEFLLWPDSDEMFSDYFREPLDRLLAGETPSVRTLPVDVFGQMDVIRKRSMSWHIRAMRFLPELTALPWRGKCRYHPFENGELTSKYTIVHLANLNADIVEWRKRYWSDKANKYGNGPLWRIPKPANEMHPEEIMKVLQSEPDMTVNEYLRNA